MVLCAAITLVASCAGGGGDDATSSTVATTSTTVLGSTTTCPPPPPTDAPTTTFDGPLPTDAPTTTAPPSSAPGLRQGDEGPEVLALQQRLDELGYWMGTPDGIFEGETHHAVVALQKVAGLARDGIAGPDTQAALADGIRPAARSTAGRVIEIDLPHQVLLVVLDGQVEHVLDTSTGRVAGTTPVGRWIVDREIDGPRHAPLGLLYRPKYFHGGVAVHGFTSVPPYAASHGCVRVTYPAMDWIWASGVMPLGTAVLVY